MTCTEAVETLALEDILKRSREQECTGLLTLHVNGSSTRAYMIDGCIIGVATDDPACDLGRFLVAAEVLPPDKLAPARRLKERCGKTLDEVLLKAGAVDPDMLERCRSAHAAETLLGLDLYGSARCEFEPDVLPEDVSGDLAVEIGAILAERSRRATRTRQLASMLELGAHLVARSSLSACPAGRDEPALLALVDGERTVEQLCVESGLGRWRTLDALEGLRAQGLVCLRTSSDPDPDEWLELDSPLEDAFATQALEPEAVASACDGRPLGAVPTEAQHEAQRWLNLAEEHLAAGVYDKSVFALQRAEQAAPGVPSVAGQVRESRQRLSEALRQREFPAGSQLFVSHEAECESLERVELSIIQSLTVQPDVDSLLAESALDELETLLTLKRLRDQGVLQPA